MKKKILCVTMAAMMLFSGCVFTPDDATAMTESDNKEFLDLFIDTETDSNASSNVSVEPYTIKGITTDKWDVTGNTDVIAMSDAEVEQLIYDMTYKVNRNFAEAWFARLEKFCNDNDIPYKPDSGAGIVPTYLYHYANPLGDLDLKEVDLTDKRAYKWYFTAELEGLETEGYADATDALYGSFCKGAKNSFLDTPAQGYFKLYQTKGSAAAADAMLLFWLEQTGTPLFNDDNEMFIKEWGTAENFFSSPSFKGNMLKAERYATYEPSETDKQVWSDFFDAFHDIESTVYAHIKTSCAENGVTLSDIDSKISLDLLINGITSSLFANKLSEDVLKFGPLTKPAEMETFALYPYVNDVVKTVINNTYWTLSLTEAMSIFGEEKAEEAALYMLGIDAHNYIGYITETDTWETEFLSDESFNYLDEALSTMEKAFAAENMSLRPWRYEDTNVVAPEEFFLEIPGSYEKKYTYHNTGLTYDGQAIVAQPFVCATEKDIDYIDAVIPQQCTFQEYLDAYAGSLQREEEDYRIWDAANLRVPISGGYYSFTTELSNAYIGKSRLLKECIVAYEALTGKTSPVKLEEVLREEKRLSFRDLHFYECFVATEEDEALSKTTEEGSRVVNRDEAQLYIYYTDDYNAFLSE